MKINKYSIKLIILFTLTLSSKAHSFCDFKTAEYIDKLESPKSIKSIKITIPKARAYLKNFFRIITFDKTSSLAKRNFVIPNRLKKEFKAKINVSYIFGDCSYKGTVRQHGDLHDHVILKKGIPIRSLKINLKNGNILNTTRFRLLIPETRNSHNEILGSIVLNNLGFITPKSSEVLVSVNNNNYKMIFSDDSRKEMLERNHRREGPIFSGDESLFDSEKLSDEQMHELSLARLINHKWFLKGESSKEITLNAFSKVQNLYLQQTALTNDDDIWEPDLISKFDNTNSKIFKSYSFLLLAMNGKHGLNLHNRKFYFNSLSNSFEPIYHDGNLNLTKKISRNYLNAININNFEKDYKFEYSDLIKNKEFKEKILIEFKKRVLKFDEETKKYFAKSFSVLKYNTEFFQSYLDQNLHLNPIPYKNKIARQKYIDKSKKLLPDQSIINNVRIGNNHIISEIEDKKLKKIFTHYEFSKILRSRPRKSSKKRYVFLPFSNINLDNNLIGKKIVNLKGDIFHTKGIKIKVMPEIKRLIFTQIDSRDWVKIDNANLEGWEIIFNGKSPNNKYPEINQRFNKYGLTGCLNIYNSRIYNSSFKVSNGQCEDSLNIINSNGSINKLNIINAYQDGIDIDFSDIRIDEALISKAGNDCLDVSGGNYYLLSGSFSNCKDKAISIGEKSLFNIENVFIQNAISGINIKDLSKLYLNNGFIKDSEICVSAYQKKQEFGGGLGYIKNLECDGETFVDKNSSIYNL